MQCLTRRARGDAEECGGGQRTTDNRTTMLVHTMNLPELVADARQDWPSIHRKTERLLHGMYRRTLGTREDRAEVMEWTSPRGNRWLLKLVAGKRRRQVVPLALYRSRRGKLLALLCAPVGPCVLFTPHSLERYRQRAAAEASELMALAHLLMDLSVPGVAPAPEPGRPHAVQVSFADGLGFGEHKAGDVVVLHTFVSCAMLRPEQAELHARLEHEAWWMGLSAGQRAFVEREVARRSAEE